MKAELSARKIAKIILVLMIGILGTYYYFAGSAKRPAAVDTEILRIAPGFKPGLPRNTVAGILTSHGFKLSDRAPSKKDPLHREVFVRSASKPTFAWVRYDVLVEYDGNDTLKAVRFLKSGSSDSKDTSCVILHGMPSAGTSYPSPCPPDVQDF